MVKIIYNLKYHTLLIKILLIKILLINNNKMIYNN